MKTIKLSLLCLALSNIILLRPMEVGYEEEEYPNYFLQQFQSDHIQIMEENSEEEENISNQESLDISADLSMQLTALSFSATENISDTQIIENLFATLDPYDALLKSIDLINIYLEGDLEHVPQPTKELLIFLVNQTATIQDIIPLLKRSIDEADHLITAVIICSLDISLLSDKFYDKFVYLYKGIRSIGGENKQVFASLSNIPYKLWLPILTLQLATGYKLLPLENLAHNAFIMGNCDLIILMILHDIIFVDKIFKAALFGDIKYLQQTQFDINALDPSTGLSLIGFAAIGRQDETAEYLINNGADVENGNNLHVAAFFGNLPIVELLIKNHANIRAKCGLMHFNNLLPIDMALKGKHKKIAHLLFELELNSASQPDKDEKQNTFKYALWYSNNNILKQLLASYPQFFSPLFLNTAEYPLHLAAKNNCSQLASLLLNAGINVNQKNSNLQTALHVAATFGNHKVIKHILESNAQVQLKDNKNLTALDYAKLAIVSAKTVKEQTHALKSFQYLLKALKDELNHFESEDFPQQLNRKRRLASLSLKSTFMQFKNQKTELTEGLKSCENVEPLSTGKNN